MVFVVEHSVVRDGGARYLMSSVCDRGLAAISSRVVDGSESTCLTSFMQIVCLKASVSYDTVGDGEKS